MRRVQSVRASARRNSANPAPWNALTSNAPPGCRCSLAKSSASSQRLAAPSLVGRCDAAQIGGHIRKDKVHALSGESLFDRGEHGSVRNIAADDGDTEDGAHFQRVHGDYSTPRANLLGRDLRPAAGRGTKIDDELTRRKEAILGVDRQQLERRPRTVAQSARFSDVRIRDMPPHPVSARPIPFIEIDLRARRRGANLPGLATHKWPSPFVSKDYVNFRGTRNSVRTA